MNTCPTCGQPVKEERAGVKMSTLKARIFDAIKRAGTSGLTANDLVCIIGDTNHTSIKSHIWQLNDALTDTGFKIQSRPYRLVTCPSPTLD